MERVMVQESAVLIEYTLNDHVRLHDEERGKHEEGMDGSAWRPVSGIVERNRPGQVILALVSAELFTTEPLESTARTCSGGRIFPISKVGAHRGARVLGEEVAAKEHGATNEAETEDNGVLIKVLGVL